MEELTNWAINSIESIPLWAALLLLLVGPNFPIPATVITIVSGGVLVLNFGLVPAILITSFGYALAFLWVYPFMNLIPHQVKNFIGQYHTKLPKGVGPFTQTLIIRNLPGVPLCVQTYMLLLMHVPFIPYLVISTLMQAVGITLLLTFGKAILTSGNPLIALGIVLILVITLVTINRVKERLNLERVKNDPRTE